MAVDLNLSNIYSKNGEANEFESLLFTQYIYNNHFNINNTAKLAHINAGAFSFFSSRESDYSGFIGSFTYFG